MASKYLSDKQEVESCVKNSPHIPERDESALQEQTDSLALKSQALACSLKIPSYAEFVVNRPPQSVTQRYFTQHYFGELNSICIKAISQQWKSSWFTLVGRSPTKYAKSWTPPK